MEVLSDKRIRFEYILAGIAVDCLLVVLDFHLCRVIEYYARQTPRRAKRLKQEAEEAARLKAEE